MCTPKYEPGRVSCDKRSRTNSGPMDLIQSESFRLVTAVKIAVGRVLTKHASRVLPRALDRKSASTTYVLWVYLRRRTLSELGGGAELMIYLMITTPKLSRLPTGAPTFVTALFHQLLRSHNWHATNTCAQPDLVAKLYFLPAMRLGSLCTSLPTPTMNEGSWSLVSVRANG